MENRLLKNIEMCTSRFHKYRFPKYVTKSDDVAKKKYDGYIP